MSKEMKALTEKRATLAKEMQDILTAAKGETRTFTEEENNRLGEIEQEIGAIDNTIETEKRATALLAKQSPVEGGGDGEQGKNANEAEETAVCTDRYATAPLTRDNDTELTYGDVTEVPSTLISVKYTPKMNSAEQYASGIAVDSYVTKAGGTLDVTVVGLDAEDENRYFGSSVSENGLITSNKNDTVPDLMVIYSTKRSDGKINLYKFPKAKFTSQGEQTETTDANGIKYSGTALKAEYKNTINNGDDMYIIKAVDPTTPEGKQTIDDWFATATGGLELAKALQTASEDVGAE